VISIHPHTDRRDCWWDILVNDMKHGWTCDERKTREGLRRQSAQYVEDTGALVDVHLCAVVSAGVVSVVLLTALPVDATLALADAIFGPVEAHVDGA